MDLLGLELVSITVFQKKFLDLLSVKKVVAATIGFLTLSKVEAPTKKLYKLNLILYK